MKTILLTSLVVAAATASTAFAQPSARPARRGCAGGITMPDDRCAPTEPPLFEIAHRRYRANTFDTLASTKLWASGAWTFQDSSSATAARTAAGYLDAATVKRVAGELAAATWKTHASGRVHCRARSADFTAYLAGAKQVWTAELCQDAVLDDGSGKTLAEVERVLAEAAQPARTASVPPPHPACLPTGTPIVELDYQDVRPKAAQAALAVFPSGAWTFEETVEGGSGAATKRAGDCLSGDVLAKLEADLAAAKWQVSHNRIHCMAMALESTAVKVNGKLVFTEKLCNSDGLDDNSAKRLADIEALLQGPSAHRSGVSPAADVQ